MTERQGRARMHWERHRSDCPWCRTDRPCAFGEGLRTTAEHAPLPLPASAALRYTASLVVRTFIPRHAPEGTKPAPVETVLAEVRIGGRVPLPPRLDLIPHSPTGFGWGYGGSGPAQLALALLAHAFGSDEVALRYYQRFKEDVVTPLPGETGWFLEVGTVWRWALERRLALAVAHIPPDFREQVRRDPAMRRRWPWAGREWEKAP